MDTRVDGALTCARYAFAPNYYHYCGPDTHGEIGWYIGERKIDRGLHEHLTSFETLYPYLTSIAQGVGIDDPFDSRVVEAYWVGNRLLESLSTQSVYRALTEGQKLERRLHKNEMKWLLPKIEEKARLHHSFHVFNVFTRTGHKMVAHTVESMDKCRIGWGKIIHIKQGVITLASQELRYKNGQLKLEPMKRPILIADEKRVLELKRGMRVSYHWDYFCDTLRPDQERQLAFYTNHHLAMANKTI